MTVKAVTDEGKQLREVRLHLVQLAAIAIIVVTAGLFVAATPVYKESLTSTLAHPSSSVGSVLRELGESSEERARIALVVELLVPITYFVVGLFIFFSRLSDLVAILVAVGLVTYIAWISPMIDTLAALPGWRLPTTVIQVVGFTSVLLFTFAFPDGRLVPRAAHYLLGLWSFCVLAWVLFPGSPFDLSNLYRLSLVSFVIMFGWLGIGLAAQLYRFYQVASPTQRQQLKVIMYSMAFGLVGFALFGFDRFTALSLTEQRATSAASEVVGVPLFMLTKLVMPVAFAIAIFRYRLWAIDLVINRTLVYGVVTAILAGFYSALSTLFRSAFRSLTGADSELATFISTLIAISLYTPIKDVVERQVDRYIMPPLDPMKKVRSFGEQVRALTTVFDVEDLCRKVLDEAVGAFYATGGAVYLQKDGQYQMVYSTGQPIASGASVFWLQDGDERYGWFAIGPHRKGRSYPELDTTLFQETVDQIAHAIRVLDSRFPGRSTNVTQLSR